MNPISEANTVPHPIPYQGSKRHLANVILSYLPPKVGRLVEPFCGSAALSLAAARRHLTTRFWLNDAHQPLYRLWAEILERPEHLSTDYRNLWKQQIGQERTFYDVVRDRFNAHQSPADFLYLLARCVKAAIRYNAEGKFNNSPDNRRLGAEPARMRDRIMGANQLLQVGTRLTCLDYRPLLKDVTSDDIVYMDPPYQGVCGKRDGRYSPSVDHAEFVDSLADLIRRKSAFLVSYDGRTGDRVYGEHLPEKLGLTRIELAAGRSTQATLLGRDCQTFESLYLSPRLLALRKGKKAQPSLFD